MKCLEVKTTITKCNESPIYTNQISEKQESSQTIKSKDKDINLSDKSPDKPDELSKNIVETKIGQSSKPIVNKTVENVTRQLMFDSSIGNNLCNINSEDVSNRCLVKLKDEISSDAGVNHIVSKIDLLENVKKCLVNDKSCNTLTDSANIAEVENVSSISTPYINTTTNFASCKNNHHSSDISTQSNNNSTSSGRHHHSHHQRHHRKGSTLLCSSSNVKHSNGSLGTTSTSITSESSYQSRKCSKCYKRSKIRHCNVGVQCVQQNRISTTNILQNNYNKNKTLNKIPGFEHLKYGRFFNIEIYPNGGASVVHLDQDTIDILSPDEMEVLVDEFFQVCFAENEDGYAHHVMGIVHNSAAYLPDLIEHMAENYSTLTVKAGVLGRSSDIETCTMAQYYEQVRNFFFL